MRVADLSNKAAQFVSPLSINPIFHADICRQVAFDFANLRMKMMLGYSAIQRNIVIKLQVITISNSSPSN
jgi:hypothetical protein